MFRKLLLRIVLVMIILTVFTSCKPSLSEMENISITISPESPSISETATPIRNTDEPKVIITPTTPVNFPQINIAGAQLKEINDENGLLLMLDANSAWTRQDYRWRTVQPSEGPIVWENAIKLDEQLINAASVGMEVILILGDAPVWARYPNWPCGGRINPEKYEIFKEFMYEFVKRYSNPPFNVKYFEMWNEPDAAGLLGCWGDPSDGTYYGGEAYGEMLKVAYPAAKLANPDVEILVGGLLLDCDPRLGLTNSDGSIKNCVPSNFLNGVMEAGAGDSFDGVAFHAYDYFANELGLGMYGNSNFNGAWNTTGPVTLEKSKFVRSILQEYGYSDKYLMNTEAGLLCNNCVSTSETMQITKAYYVVQEFAVALADGYVANIWYSVYGDRNSGLMTLDNKPYPVYHAFSLVSHALENHGFVRELDFYSGVMGYEFISKSGKIQWVLWSIDGQEHLLKLDSPPSSLQKIADSGHGETMDASTDVIIGIAPVFIIY